MQFYLGISMMIMIAVLMVIPFAISDAMKGRTDNTTRTVTFLAFFVLCYTVIALIIMGAFLGRTT